MTRMIFRTITFVEVVKLMRIHRSRVSAMYSVGLDAFLVIFLTPIDIIVTSDPIIFCA